MMHDVGEECPGAAFLTFQAPNARFENQPNISAEPLSQNTTEFA
jgi:hypothetical protein